MASRFLTYCVTVTLCLFLHDFGAEATKRRSQYAVKTIETEDGDVYDCVDFYKQPAFDHPLLKNHSFHPEMRPSSMPRWVREKRSQIDDGLDIDIRFKEGGCPQGTVPIKRNNEDDFFEAKFLQQRYAQLGVNQSYTGNDGDKIYFAIAQSKYDPTRTFYGAGATVTVFNPQVGPSQYSSTEIIVKGGVDTLVAGWTVNPTVYKDNKTRSFVFAVAGGLHCYNAECGFVLTRPDVALGGELKPVSKIGGPIYVNKFLIFQDAKDGNWWVALGWNLTVVGFWPKNIFQGLHDSASYIACGGEVFRPDNTEPPKMGTGYYPMKDSPQYNAYCQDMAAVGKSQKMVFAQGFTETFSTDDRFYEVSKQDRHRFVIYGGPDVY